ncbi:phosphopantetheine attachment site family protein [Spirillospora albida]|uniref:phosphopantetheine attachment site family protein n=1 Tax=Spirillospora albida TaxID=58123 RepID=UPI00068A8607|nr:phosphopantetheine attachment site family protein [Spirillospora albida]
MHSEAVENRKDAAAAAAAASIRSYVRGNVTGLDGAGLRDDDNIFEKGFVASMFAMQLLLYIESTFDVEVPDGYITLRNFSSVERMAEMVGELKAAAGD